MVPTAFRVQRLSRHNHLGRTTLAPDLTCSEHRLVLSNSLSAWNSTATVSCFCALKADNRAQASTGPTGSHQLQTETRSFGYHKISVGNLVR